MIHRLVKDKSLYVVGLYPSPETDDTNRDFMWNTFLALSWTYNCNVILARDPKEVINLRALPQIGVEQKTAYTIPLQDFEHPETAVYYVGNSQHSHPSYWAETDRAVHIDVPALEHPLYGCQAAAIVLHDRYIKNGTGI